jgi:hypothetical protein
MADKKERGGIVPCPPRASGVAGIAGVWREVHRRRMWHFRKWTRGRGFCRGALRILAQSATPEEALLRSAVAPNDDRVRFPRDIFLEAPYTVASALGLDDLTKQFGYRTETELVALAEADRLVREPAWRAVAWNTEPTP